MNSALILLIRLRFWGFLRREGRRMATAKGLLVTLFGLAFFGAMIVPSLLTKMPPEALQTQIEGFRRFGPYLFVVYCLLILLLSPGDKAFAFSPAEVSFLFPAPFGRKSLLEYKIGSNLALLIPGGFFFLWAFRQFWTNAIAGYLGVVLTFGFLQLFQVGVTVAGQAIGAKAATRRRQLALALLAAIGAMFVFSLGIKSLSEMDLESFKKLEHANWVVAIKAPFQPFINLIAAPRLWPDAALWFSIALAINAAVVLAILSLDAQYLEAAAASSERFYAKLERVRSGAPIVISRRKNQKWKSLPNLPWLGGAGPILWRQFTTSIRDYARAVAPFAISTLIGLMGIFIANSQREPSGELAIPMGIGILALAISLTMVLTFDFRGDFERMEGLKTLPLKPSSIVLGQIATPCILLTAGQYFGLTILAYGVRPISPMLWVLFAFAPLTNLVLIEIDNLFFLHFPSKQVTHTPGDFHHMGKMMILMFGKMIVLLLAGGLAALFGFLTYLLAGITAGIAIAWIILAGVCVCFVPLLAISFHRLDVASDL